MARTLIGMPARARRGAVIEIKTLIAHPMETGFRLRGENLRSMSKKVKKLEEDLDNHVHNGDQPR